MGRRGALDGSEGGVTWAIAIHGGAGVVSRRDLAPEREQKCRQTLAQALEAGAAVLREGGKSIDAVAAAVVVLEDSGVFNAGRGAVCARDGSHELDASIMDGETLRAGAVASVRKIRNPVLVALAVMRDTRHVLLVGTGAEAFSKKKRFEEVTESYFVRTAPKRHGTVGAVALDLDGNLAAATSTGGTTAKLPGRVGDSPIIGAGTYAANDTCAVSGTGLGEAFMRSALAYDVAARMRYLRVPLAAAAAASLRKVAALGGDGGLVAVDRRGRIAMPFNSEGMYRASLAQGGRSRIALIS